MVFTHFPEAPGNDYYYYRCAKWCEILPNQNGPDHALKILEVKELLSLCGCNKQQSLATAILSHKISAVFTRIYDNPEYKTTPQ